MTQPSRIQLSRRKGWKMPPNTVSVARPHLFGNPFKVSDLRDCGYTGSGIQLRGRCVVAFRQWLAGSSQWWQGPESDRRRAAILARLPELRGKNLACWCEPFSPCHADVLLDLANAPAKAGDA